MKRISLLLFLLAFLFANTYGQFQTDDQIDKAVALMDNQDYQGSYDILESIIKRTPDHYRANYEMAFLCSMTKQYDKSLECLKRIKKSDQVNDRYYQLLGSVYDYKGDPKKAISVYKQGLKLFPKSGNLCLELGIMYMSQKDFDEAIGYFEQGIMVEPMFPSNYYYAGLLFLSSSEPVWGLMYGEIFLNIEKEGARAEKMSETLTKTLCSKIEKSDTAFEVSLTNNNSIYFSHETLRMNLGFPLFYSMTLDAAGTLVAKEGANAMSLSTLGKMHSYQLACASEQFDGYQNVLFDYLSKVKEAGFIEEYCALLYNGGFPTEYSEWMAEHRENYLKFLAWRSANPLMINENNAFCRQTCSNVLFGVRDK